MVQLTDSGTADGQHFAVDGGGLPFGVEAHCGALYQVLHLILVDIGIHLPTAGVDEDANGLAAVDPLAGLPARVQVQPLAAERCLQGQTGDFRACGTCFFELHVEALTGSNGLVSACGVSDQPAEPGLITFGTGLAAG
ncbi:hypothetical protein D3C78_1018200 [compost metagenome]